jgi:hypothetical protein
LNESPVHRRSSRIEPAARSRRGLRAPGARTRIRHRRSVRADLPPRQDRQTPDDAAAPPPPRDASISFEGTAVGAVDAASPVDAANDVTPIGIDGAVLPPERYRAIDVVAGRYHMCALLDDHEVKCWGLNAVGQLGLGDTRDRVSPADMGDNLPTVDLGTGRTAKAIAAGRYTTCAILDDDSAKCWGLLGGANPGQSVGYAPTQMGDALAPLDLGQGRSARLVTVGAYGLCVVRDDETTRCWVGSVKDFPAPPGAKVRQLVVYRQNPIELLNDGTFVGAPASVQDGGVVSIGLTPPQAGGVDVAATAIAAFNDDEVCAAYADGEISCSNTGPVIGWFPPNVQFSALILPEDGWFCALLTDGRVACQSDPQNSAPWGRAIADASGVWVALGQPAVASAGGVWNNFCAALANGEVKCWGQYPDNRAAGGSIPTADGWPSVDLGTRPR